MGKKIMKASIWTWRSIFNLYNKLITTIFIVFCITSGLFTRTASAKTINGVALIGKDSTPLKNIKIFSCSVAMPLYGAGFNPYFTAVDSTFTDESGNFSINLDETKFGGVDFAILKIDTINKYDRFHSVSGELLDYESIQVPLILHMYPIVRTDIKDKLKPQSFTFSPTIYGNTLSIKIADWSSNEKYSAKVYNISGRVVASPIVLKDGIISWNIANVTRGAYYLVIENGIKTVNTRITVK